MRSTLDQRAAIMRSTLDQRERKNGAGTSKEKWRNCLCLRLSEQREASGAFHLALGESQLPATAQRACTAFVIAGRLPSQIFQSQRGGGKCSRLSERGPIAFRHAFSLSGASGSSGIPAPASDERTTPRSVRGSTDKDPLGGLD